MKKTISTKRLVLRPLSENDFDMMYEIYSDADTVRYLMDEPWTPETAGQEFEKKLKLSEGTGGFAYAVTVDGRMIGCVSARLTEMDGTWEIGYVFHPSGRHMGYASEAVRAMAEDLFRNENTHRLFTDLDARNRDSAALCERIGMRREGHFIQDCWCKGEWTDSYNYGMLKSDL